jgi:phosphate transport system substrate-binding protein
LLLQAFLVLNFIGCDFGEIKSKSTIGEMTLTVDENLQPLMTAQEKEFERLNPEAKLDIRYAPTNNTIAEFINGQVQTILVSRNFTNEERNIINQYKIPVDSHMVAVDGIGFIVNPQNPAERLTSEDLRKIFTGEYTKWSDIKSQDEEQNKSVASRMGGSSDKIKVFIQRKNSYTYDFVKESVLKNADYTQAAVICSTSAQMLAEVRANVNAIGISNSAWLSIGNQDVLDSTVKSVRVGPVNESGRQEDFVQFHQGFVANGNYPYRRIVYVFTTEKGIGLPTGFVTYLLSTQGQKVVLKQGLVPVSQPVRTIQLN